MLWRAAEDYFLFAQLKDRLPRLQASETSKALFQKFAGYRQLLGRKCLLVRESDGLWLPISRTALVACSRASFVLYFD